MLRATMLSRLISLVIILVWLLFAAVHAHRVFVEHAVSSIPLFLVYSLFLGLFIFRRRPVQTTRKPADWIAASTMWLALFVRPSDSPTVLYIAGSAVGFAGVIMLLFSATALGRSFGIVAANRGLKAAGAYQFVRHPVYMSESVMLFGTLVSNPSVWNAAVIFGTVAGLVIRIHSEERLLTATTDYAEYAGRVRWRLVPGIY
jgi:protein-S-isoprenylcysteine O-methyltransferase Ste14